MLQTGLKSRRSWQKNRVRLIWLATEPPRLSSTVRTYPREATANYACSFSLMLRSATRCSRPQMAAEQRDGIVSLWLMAMLSHSAGLATCRTFWLPFGVPTAVPSCCCQTPGWISGSVWNHAAQLTFLAPKDGSCKQSWSDRQLRGALWKSTPLHIEVLRTVGIADWSAPFRAVPGRPVEEGHRKVRSNPRP